MLWTLSFSVEMCPAVGDVDVWEAGERNEYFVIFWPTDCSPNINAFLIWPTLPPCGESFFNKTFWFPVMGD